MYIASSNHSFDHNDEFGVSKPSFKSYFKDYDIEKTAAQFKGFTTEYLTSCSEAEGDGSDINTGAAEKTRKIARGRHSYLMLPKGIGSVSVLPSNVLTIRHPSQARQHLKWQKSLVRAMVTDMSTFLYWHPLSSSDLAYERDRGTCPWKAMTSNPSAFFEQTVFMPSIQVSDTAESQVLVSVQLEEPSKMQQDTIRRILKHWKQRQNQGLVPFAFSHVLRAGVMVQALPLNVPARALLPLSTTQILDHDTIDEELDLPFNTAHDVSTESVLRSAASTAPPVSHHYPSPAPTTPADHDSPSPPPRSVTPETQPPLPGTPLEEAVPALEPDIQTLLAESVIDPVIPELTKTQLLITGPEAFTTNTLAGARISQSPDTAVHIGTGAELSPIENLNPPENPETLKLFAEFIKFQRSTKASNEVLLTPEPTPSRKRGRPRKSLVGTEGKGDVSPPKKRSRRPDASALSMPTSSNTVISAPNSVIALLRPKPCPSGKNSGKKIDFANVPPYDGLITRRMAAGRTEKVVAGQANSKGAN